jgi:hypothetical protein
MTLDRLQGIVLRLANVVPVRYWMHFNYPCQEPWHMAVKIYPAIPPSQFRHEMKSLGGRWDDNDLLWTFERTNEDGSPFRSNL